MMYSRLNFIQSLLVLMSALVGVVHLATNPNDVDAMGALRAACLPVPSSWSATFDPCGTNAILI
jgi:hypothetical protein